MLRHRVYHINGVASAEQGWFACQGCIVSSGRYWQDSVDCSMGIVAQFNSVSTNTLWFLKFHVTSCNIKNKNEIVNNLNVFNVLRNIDNPATE